MGTLGGRTSAGKVKGGTEEPRSPWEGARRARGQWPAQALASAGYFFDHVYTHLLAVLHCRWGPATMGKYHYDESGNMAAMFVLTFLAIVLIPLSLSFSPFSRGKLAGITPMARLIS